MATSSSSLRSGQLTPDSSKYYLAYSPRAVMSTSPPRDNFPRGSALPTLTGVLTNCAAAMDAIHQSRLIKALRSGMFCLGCLKLPLILTPCIGDPSVIHPFLIDIANRPASQVPDEPGAIDVAASTLHLAIRCASYDTVKLLLANRAINPNGIHPPSSGTTPLHLAASLARDDLVALLLEQPEIDDTVRDSNGKSCKDVARGKETLAVIQQSRQILDARFLSLLHTYVLSQPNAPPPPELLAILESPRARLLDLSQLEQTNGTTLLHEAARRKDLRLVELAIRAGADVFCRDRRGRSINDVAGKDDRVKVFLRQYTNRNTALIEPQPAGEPGVMKGHLNKYVNVAKGYSTRWFVLRDGVLSYYRNQADEGIASRGSIAMKSATLKTTGAADKLRFEIHSHLSGLPGPGSTSGAGGGVQKWFLKANHYVELTRWTNALNASIDWSKDHEASPVRGSHVQSATDGSDLSSLHRARTNSLIGLDNQSSIRSASSSGKRHSTPYRHRHQSTHSRGSMTDVENGPPAESDRERSHGGGDDADSFESSSRSAESAGLPPHSGTMHVHANATTMQLETMATLVRALLASKDGLAGRRGQELGKELADSSAAAQEMFTQYVRMAAEREEWWISQLERERARAGVWEESLQIAAKEGEELEAELKRRGRARGRQRRSIEGSWNFTEAGPASTIKINKKRTDVPAVNEGSAFDGLPGTSQGAPAVLLGTTPVEGLAVAPAGDRSSRIIPTSIFASQQLSTEEKADQDEEVDTDEEDEFFDAIESNSLPVVIPAALEKTPVHITDLPPSLDLALYQSYRNLRERLPISADNRPPVSLWAVLKNSIGKDLTKISFPVFFNEPTSMLQRMAEDMEFSECLDSAATEKDQYKRLAFVAGFAMSNYSSTIGRIAKPFNPMLGETFEYVRIDRRYRYVSEQVSHHPPISACWCESPLWKYYGEVDAQNKFMGKSFEIRPTGVAHAQLDLKDVTYEGLDEKPRDVTEHYSWKKVTTCVSGFILGSPTIDHYGDMTITNHATGDTCLLTFKPRGWRSTNAFEISGRVLDKFGRPRLDIAGRWNSQLVARESGTGAGDLLPDIDVDANGPASPSIPPAFTLLWRNTVKPTMPFNLSPFAITLNDCPPELKSNICPTDCRMRPDQRAFENGKYERANSLKQQQEDFQRTTRRKRENGQLPPHEPRWFKKTVDDDTGERVWMPHFVGEQPEYWAERDRVARRGGVEKERWKKVDTIFITDDA
ncbi:Oxysterol-binding protein-domain-containing protein [Auriculariales sp. MPI-PUGE-AT-0066]|nr:Oxysterol-binding protein-domain-containing protein [Auriculariales sp. MPI-PUGE-AT-0066]